MGHGSWGLSGPHSQQGGVALTHRLILAQASWMKGENPACTLHKINMELQNGPANPLENALHRMECFGPILDFRVAQRHLLGQVNSVQDMRYLPQGSQGSPNPLSPSKVCRLGRPKYDKHLPNLGALGS